MIEIITNDFKKRFINLIKNTQKKLVFCSPFLKKNIMKEIFENVDKNLEIEIITSANLANFLIGASDIEVLEELLAKKIKIKNYQNLNNQIYFFDNQVLLTQASVDDKKEYGILSDSLEEESFLKQFFSNMIQNTTFGQISNDEYKDIKLIYNRINRKCNYHYDYVGDLILRISKITDLTNRISASWQKNMLLYLNSNILSDTFTLKQLYSGINFFQILYPESDNVDARMRRTLQELRDRGLIKFYGNGVYKKLWTILY